MSIINEWDSMSDAAQLDMISRCINKAAKQAGLRGVDAAEYVGATWERLTAKLKPAALDAENSRRAEDGKQQLTLVSAVYHAAAASIAACTYDERKRGADISINDALENGGSGYLEALLTSGRDSTETSAVLRVDMERFRTGRDVIDQRIMELAAGGYTEREIAGAIGIMSNVAVHKRLVKMRAALMEATA